MNHLLCYVLQAEGKGSVDKSDEIKLSEKGSLYPHHYLICFNGSSHAFGFDQDRGADDIVGLYVLVLILVLESYF
jgi:hypothetical protein